MPSPSAILRLVCALGGLMIAGCYAPYRPAPYNPYSGGIPVYPQTVPVQPQFAPPGGTVAPGGTFPPANSFDGGLTPTPDPGAGGTFPPSNSGTTPYNFDPNLPSNSSPGLVPNYGDPETLPPSSGSGTFEGDNREPFRSDGASFQPNDATQAVGSVRFERDTASRELQLTAHQPPTAESEPVVFTSDEMFQSAENTAIVTQKPNPYGYDAVGYRWLRGIVDFDEKEQSWILIYNPAPGPQDAYKGQIMLVDNGQMRNIKSNDVVLVEGQVDLSTGRPHYRIAKLIGPLVPKT